MGFPGDALRNPKARSTADRHDRAPSGDGQHNGTAFRWVPIRSLADRHRARIAAHLLALGDADRYLRFGYAASDAQIAHYVDTIDFERDEVLGIFNRRLELIAMAHLAGLPGSVEAEFGVSVLAHARGRGYGQRLFDHAALHARNRGVERLVIHALNENAAMLHIARAAGAKVERAGGESHARLRLAPDGVLSHLDQWIEDRAAEIDYRLKRRSHHPAAQVEPANAGPA